MNGAAFFSTDYGIARNRFCAAANRLKLKVESHAIAAKGPQGEALSIEVATVGSPQCRKVVVVSSGLHGVEGFLGSAAQLAWLATFASAAELPQQVRVILVHALNPFGFAWLRRWNENNVDLNRNFLVDRDFIASPLYRETLAAYDRHFAFLNPVAPPSAWDPYTLRAMARIVAAGCAARRRVHPDQRPSPLALTAIAQLGLAEMRTTLLAGQYQYQNGLFYGGDGAQESTAWLQRQLPAWVDGAELTLHVDLHSGLGERADCKLLIVDRKGSPRARWLAQRFGDDAVETCDDRTAFSANGAMASYFRERNVGGIYHGLTAEFGTYSGIRVLAALRAENQAHFYADRDSPSYRWAKRQVLEAFAPAAGDWRDAVITKSLALVERAIAVCARDGSEQPMDNAPAAPRADPCPRSFA